MTRRPPAPPIAPAVLGLAALALLTACVVGPAYKGAPAPKETPAAFRRADAQGAAQPAAQWWRALGDAELDRLVDQALAGNPDLEAVRARLRQARAGISSARAALYPTPGASLADLHAKGLTNALGGQAARAGASDFYNAFFDATWELDLFGGSRRALEGARAGAEAAAARAEDAQVALAADVVQTYVQLRTLQTRQRLAARALDLEIEGLRLSTLRQRGGTASDLDLEALKADVAASKASLTPLSAQVHEALDRLAVLTGEAPGALDVRLATPAPAPPPPNETPIGDPAGLLRRRPDVRAAERVLAQKTAVIGQRIADYFPKVQLLGSVGFGGSDVSSVFNAANLTYIAAPVLQWRPFDFGRTRAGVEAARGEAAEALAAYRSVVLKALEDAETALDRYGRRRDSVVSLTAVKAAADRALALTRLRRQGGVATELDVLKAERRVLSAEDDLIVARGRLTEDYAALQKSLGLGWEAGAVNGSSAPG